MKLLIILVFSIVVALNNCRASEELGETLHPAVIENINHVIDEILKRYPLAFPSHTSRDIGFFENLVKLYSAKLEDDATENEENVALNAIFLFHDFLELKLELKQLLSESLKEMNELAENLVLNNEDLLMLSKIIEAFKESYSHGSIEDMLKVIQAYNKSRSVLRQAVGEKEAAENDAEGQVSRVHYLRYSSYLRSHPELLQEDKHKESEDKVFDEMITEEKSSKEESPENKESNEEDSSDDKSNNENSNDGNSNDESSNEENSNDENLNVEKSDKNPSEKEKESEEDPRTQDFSHLPHHRAHSGTHKDFEDSKEIEKIFSHYTHNNIRLNQNENDMQQVVTKPVNEPIYHRHGQQNIHRLLAPEVIKLANDSKEAASMQDESKNVSLSHNDSLMKALLDSQTR